MYLTALRVHSVQKSKTGINAFLYWHGDQGVPGMSWAQPAVELVADEHVGTLSAEHVEIAPGGNRVLSFVDIVAADGTPIDQVEAAVQDFRPTISLAARLPISGVVRAVALRFGAQYGLDREQWPSEFIEIANQALSVLRKPHEPAWRTQDPLEVDVQSTDDELRFTLRSEAKRRLAEMHGADWSAPRVSISHDTQHAIEVTRGDIFRNLGAILTGLDAERVANLGGMRFLKAGSDEVLDEWPHR